VCVAFGPYIGWETIEEDQFKMAFVTGFFIWTSCFGSKFKLAFEMFS
jgi:hypothetical protein